MNNDPHHQSGREPSLPSASSQSDDLHLGGDKAVVHYIAMLSHENEAVRMRATLTLAELGHQQALETLIQMLTERRNDYGWRPLNPRIVFAFGKLAHRGAFEPLIQMLEQHPGEAKIVAIALKSIDCERAIQYFIKWLTDENASLRSAALIAMAVLDPSGVHPYILAGLTDREVQVCETALSQLKVVGISIDTVLPTLLELLDDPNRERPVIWVLEKFGVLAGYHRHTAEEARLAIEQWQAQREGR